MVNQSALITTVNYLPGNQDGDAYTERRFAGGRYLLTIRPTITDEAGNQLGGGTPYLSQLLVGTVNQRVQWR